MDDRMNDETPNSGYSPDDIDKFDVSANDDGEWRDDEDYSEETQLSQLSALDLDVTPSTGVTPLGTRPIDDASGFADDTARMPGLSSPDTAFDSDAERPNRGRARERIEKRKGKTSEQRAVAGRPHTPPVRNVPPRERTVRDPSQIVTRGITSARSAAQTAVRGAARAMPDAQLRMPVNRVGLYLFGSLVFVVIVVFVLGQIRNRPTSAPPNAIWLGTEWTFDPITEAQVFALTERLKQHQIGTVFAYTAYLRADSTWSAQEEVRIQSVIQFVGWFDKYYPEAELYAWVGVPIETPDIPYRGDDEILHQAVADFSKRVVDEYGYDGVHLNVEQIWNADEGYLAMLRRVRQTVGNDVFVSVTIPPDWSPIGAGIPVPPLIVPGTVWERDYKQSVALLVDQMVVMAYNSGLGAPSDYTQWMAYQVQTFAESISELGGGTEIIIGIPTYDDEPPGHYTSVENVITAVEGIKLGIELSGTAADFVRGAAIYASWETDDQEWSDFLSAWVRAN